MDSKYMDQVFNLKFTSKQLVRSVRGPTRVNPKRWVRSESIQVLCRVDGHAEAALGTAQAKKCEKDEKSEKGKVKKAIEKGNIEGARIYAQNAIRKKTEQLNYLKVRKSALGGLFGMPVRTYRLATLYGEQEKIGPPPSPLVTSSTHSARGRGGGAPPTYCGRRPCLRRGRFDMCVSSLALGSTQW